MKLTVEVETARHEDARLIARALARMAELELKGSGVRITVRAGKRRRTITGPAFELASQVALAHEILALRNEPAAE